MATLSQLLTLPELGLRLVQAGPGDPELSWVSTTELLDLGGYLAGGEIVLTTGLALSDADPRWRDFVAALSRSRVAAIGFGVGVNHERIPAPLVAAASTYRVALVEVPPPVPFIAVSKAVAGLLHADELRAAQLALRIHQRLLDGARGPQDAAEVLASIAQATGRQLALVQADGTVLTSTAGFAAAGDREGSGAGSISAATDSTDSTGADRTDRTDREIAIDGDAGTRLVIAEGDPLGPEERAVVAAGAMVLGLELRGERSDDERERGRWARLTDGLLSGELDANAVSLLDPGLRLPDRIRAVAALGSAESVSAWRRRARAGFDRFVTGGRAMTGGGSLAWQLCADDEAALDRALADIAAHGLDAVVGRAGGLHEGPLSKRSALARIGSLSSAAQLYDEPRTPVVVRADASAPLLESMLADQSHVMLSGAILGPLSAHDEGSAGGVAAPTEDESGQLRGTLRAFLAHNGQRGPAAAELGIHRNTLRDRLTRIERLLGRSVDHPDDRAEMWLALRAEEVGG